MFVRMINYYRTPITGLNFSNLAFKMVSRNMHETGDVLSAILVSNAIKITQD